MDKTTLVRDDIKIGHHIIGLLAAAGIPLNDAFWVHQPQTGEWRLLLSSPWVDQKGINTAYIALSNALHKSPLLGRLPIRRISLVSPQDSLLKSVQAATNVSSSNSNQYYSLFVHDFLDSYRYEGALHIVQTHRRSKPLYSVTFAPYKAPGGAVPSLEFSSVEAFNEFMIHEIGIAEEDVRVAVRELESKGSYSFPNVHLRKNELQKLGLLQ